jgi:7-keto-8-aminopelargonate synthetase-like enzyme
LGKLFGSFGAYEAGEQPLIDLLLKRARSFVFTTALPPCHTYTGNPLACAAVLGLSRAVRERPAAGQDRRLANLLRDLVPDRASATSARKVSWSGASWWPTGRRRGPSWAST